VEVGAIRAIVRAVIRLLADFFLWFANFFPIFPPCSSPLLSKKGFRRRLRAKKGNASPNFSAPALLSRRRDFLWGKPARKSYGFRSLDDSVPSVSLARRVHAALLLTHARGLRSARPPLVAPLSDELKRREPERAEPKAKKGARQRGKESEKRRGKKEPFLSPKQASKWISKKKSPQKKVFSRKMSPKQHCLVQISLSFDGSSNGISSFCPFTVPPPWLLATDRENILGRKRRKGKTNESKSNFS